MAPFPFNPGYSLSVVCLKHFSKNKTAFNDVCMYILYTVYKYPQTNGSLDFPTVPYDSLQIMENLRIFAIPLPYIIHLD